RRLERLGKRAQVERRHRPPAHRVHVGQRIGRRHLTIQERIVDDRRDEIGGHDDAEIGTQLIHARVVPGLDADQDFGPVLCCQARHHLGKVRRTDLGGSTARGRELRDPTSLFHGGHQSFIAPGDSGTNKAGMSVRALCVVAMLSACRSAPPPAAPPSDDELARGAATAFLDCYERDGAECRTTDAPVREWAALSALALLEHGIPPAIARERAPAPAPPSEGRGWRVVARSDEPPDWLHTGGAHEPEPAGRAHIDSPGQNLLDPWLPVYEEAL